MDTYDSPAEAYIAARRHIEKKQPRDAEKIMCELTVKYPENLAYSELLLDALSRQNKTDEMLDYFRKIVERFNPTDDPVYHDIYINALRATSNSPVPLARMLRFYELTRQLQATLTIKGEVAECGCFRGMSSYLICSYLRLQQPGFNGAGYHIFDSFQGLAEPTIDDEIPADHRDAKRLQKMTRGGGFSASLESVRHNLSDFPMIEYHPGWIPISFQKLPEKTYRFVHIDVDLYDPTWDCFEYFYPRLVAGGAIVSDDYGWPGARKAIDEFCAERDIPVQVTAYNQAVFTKV